MPAGRADATVSRRASSTHARRLFVVWQNPDTRQFVRVGHLDHLVDGDYEFAYEPAAGAAEGFTGFAAFPDLNHSYRSERLFPFFTNRVMSPRRPEYENYVEALGLDDGEPTPVEILARSGGGRATDTVHVVPEPQVGAGGQQILLFLASGLRHLEGVSERLAHLTVGDVLALRPEPDNPRNDRALLLDVATEEPVGWVPDHLLELVHGYLDEGEVRVLVERVNGPDVVPHQRLLCRLEASPSQA